jgi:DNA-binding MarR family transcriptional regulator
MTGRASTRPKSGRHRSDIPCDSVDRLVASWRGKRPDLDFAPVEAISRLARVRRHIGDGLEVVFLEHGLTGPSFAVLVTLARLSRPSGVSQRRLMDELALTSGTMSVRIDRLESQGLVERHPDPGDKRNTFVRLTDTGRELFERVTPKHLDNERRLLAALDPAEQARLAELLAKLLVEFEGSVCTEDDPPLGLVLASAHLAIEMRTAVGLPADPGLLVRSVHEGGAAARAGIEPGDVLVRAAEHELRSISSLYAALNEAAARGRLRLRLLRAGETLGVSVVLPSVRRTGRLRAATRGRVPCFEHIV